MIIRAGRLYILLVVTILAGAILVRLADPFFLQALRYIAFDSYQRLAPQTYDPAFPVRIVDIDEDSLDKVGQWPWPRTTIADLLKRLTEQGAAVVAFDILFSEPDQTSPEVAIHRLPKEEVAALEAALAGRIGNDERFAKAVAESPTVLASALTNRVSDDPAPPQKAGFAVAGDDPAPFVAGFPGITSNLPILDEAAAGLGAINWVPDRDQVVRRVPLVYRQGETWVPTLVTESLRVAQGATTYILKASNASGETAFGEVTGLNHIKVGDIEVPTDADGGIWLHFRPSNPASYIPAWKVLAGENDPAEVAGKILLVGTSAPGLIDLRATPLDPSIPGVEIHAEAIEHILSGETLTRPDYALAAELVIVLLIGVALAIVLPRISAAASALLGLVAIGAVLVGGWAAFRYAGLLFDPTYATLTTAVLVASATLYVYRRVEQQRAEVRRAFGFYVAPTVVDEIIANPGRLELGGEVRELTLLFCDVRNFTSISEKLTAHELTQFINGLLTPLSEVILSKRGTIDKYMGDAIMAFWNAPLDDADHASHATEAALAMAQRMGDLNQKWRKEAETAGRPFAPVAIGIGLNTGLCCVGNLGSEQRFDYSAIGDDVNVASRFEGLSKVYGVTIVIGEPTVAKMASPSVLELDLIKVKGRSKPTRIYTLTSLLDGSAAAVERLKSLHAGMLAAYRGRDWDGAENAVAECRGVGFSGLGALYDLYAARIAACRLDPPPPDWDGSDTATTK